MLLMLSAAFHGGLGTGVNFNFSFVKARPAAGGVEAVAAKTTVKGRLPIELRAGYRFFLKNCGWFVDPVVTFNTDFGRIQQKDASDVAAAPAAEGAAAAPAAPAKKSFKAHVPFLGGLVGLDIRVGKVFGRNLAVYAFLPIPELAYAAVAKENKKELNLKFFGVSTGVGAEYKLHRNVSVTGALKVGAFKSPGADWTLKTRALVGVEVHQSNYYGD